jgi:ATP-dependent protease HslVU (ClpYQ) peptidase subunit
VFVIDIRVIEYGNTDEWSGTVSPITDDIVAVGHGQQYAYGAMEAGADPIKAVRAACKRDMTCALPVQHEKL